MPNISIEKHFELYNDKLNEASKSVSQIIQETALNHIVVPKIQRSIIWSKKKVKDLIISLYKGVPIGEITLWRLNKKNPHTDQYRTIFNIKKQLPEFIDFLLDGLQRCSALCGVFSKEKIAIDEKFQDIDLHYNIIKDIFMYREEIKELDDTWINLKDIFNPIGDNANLKQFFYQRFNSIRNGLHEEDKLKIDNRIDRIFELVSKDIKIYSYNGENINFAFDLLITKNYGVQYSPLDLLYSVISNLHPESRQLIEDFSKTTSKSLNNNYFNVHDILHLAIHLINPGNYNIQKRDMSRINVLSYNIKEVKEVISKITNGKSFSEFIETLNEAILSLLPFKNNDKEYRNKFNVCDFKTKSAFYSSYCIYLYCKEKIQEETLFHQFLGRYFIYSILLERFNKREKDVMLDLRMINGESRDYNVLEKKINEDLNVQFWTQILPQKLLEKKSRQSDLSFIYQLTLLPQMVFNSTQIKMENFLLSQNNQISNLEDKRNVNWIKIFPKDYLRNYSEGKIHYNSILNYILIDHTDYSRKRLARYQKAWGWLEEILKGKEGYESSFTSPYFEAWDFPRKYDEEMKIFHKNSKENKITDYLNEFFEIRAKKVAKRIQDIFF